MQHKFSFAAAVVCMQFSPWPAALAQPSGVTGYDLIEIRPLSGHLSSSVSGLDNLARVVGRSSVTPGTAIVWVNGTTLLVPSPPAMRTQMWQTSVMAES